MKLAKLCFPLSMAAGILLSAPLFGETRLPVGAVAAPSDADRTDEVCRPCKNQVLVLEGKVETLQAELRRLIVDRPRPDIPAGTDTAVGYLAQENQQLKELLNAETQNRLTIENDYGNLKDKMEGLKKILDERAAAMEGLQLKLSTQTEVNRKLIKEKIPAEKEIERLKATIENLSGKVAQLERELKRAELEVQNKDELLRQCYDKPAPADEESASPAAGSPQSARLQRLQEIILKIK